MDDYCNYLLWPHRAQATDNNSQEELPCSDRSVGVHCCVKHFIYNI